LGDLPLENQEKKDHRTWLVIGSIREYLEHPDLIGVAVKQDQSTFRYSFFDEIKGGDRLIYYDFYNKVIVGLFEVTSSENNTLKGDCFWPECKIKKIKPVNGYTKKGNNFFDYEIFLKKNPNLNLFYSFGIEDNAVTEMIVNLPNDNFSIIEKNFFEQAYNKEIGLSNEDSPGPTGFVANQQMMSGLLDYYNSRCTSFASLVVASIFGLVTLSAIIQTMFSANFSILSTSNYILIILSLILFLLFSASTMYTLQNYFYYATLSDKIKTFGLENPFFSELRKIQFFEQKKDKQMQITDLMESISIINQRQANSPFRKLLKHKYLLRAFSIFALGILGVFIYWHVILSII
jgi:hypothetical protein